MNIKTIKEYEDINKLIFDNFLYYKNNLLNKVVLIDFDGHFMAIKMSKENLKHLLGLHKSYNSIYQNNAFSCFNYIENMYRLNKDLKVIRYDEFIFDELSRYEKEIIKRNLYFKEIFESLLSHPKIYSHKFQNLNSSMKYDYFHDYILDFDSKILCLTSGENDNLFYPSSIINKNNNDIRGETPFKAKNVKLLTMDEFNRIKDNLDFIKPYTKHFFANKKKVNNIRFINKKNVNSINKLLPTDYKIKKGAGKKSQYNLVKNNEIICTDIQDKIESANLESSIEEIMVLIKETNIGEH